jgi:hypothetical protein
MQAVHVVDDLAGRLCPVEADNFLLRKHLREHADMAAGTTPELVDPLAVGKIGREQVLLVDPTPIELELRLGGLGEAPKQSHRQVRPDVFGRQGAEIALAGDELVQILAPPLDPAGFVTGDGDRKIPAPDAIEQAGDQFVERLPFDPAILPVVRYNRIAAGRRQCLLRMAQEPRKVGEGQGMVGHESRAGTVAMAWIDQRIR